MTKDYRAKVFKSGNSVALRLPRELGLAEGDELIVVANPDGSFQFWKESEAKTVFMNLYGSMSPGYMKNGRADVGQADYDWNRPTGTAKVA